MVVIVLHNRETMTTHNQRQYLFTLYMAICQKLSLWLKLVILPCECDI